MMALLPQYQAESGMRRSADRCDAQNRGPRPSRAPACFTFAMITGVKNGWLDASYGAAARKGWLALVSYIDENAGCARSM